MTQPTQSSQNEEKQKTTKATQLEGELRNKKINPEKLAVFMYGAGEQVLAEVEPWETEPTSVVRLKNPKRLIRLQQMNQHGLSLTFMIGDFDMVETGQVSIVPTGWFRLTDLGPESYEAYLALLTEFLDRKTVSKAQAAGLHVPGSLKDGRSLR